MTTKLNCVLLLSLFSIKMSSSKLASCGRKDKYIPGSAKKHILDGQIVEDPNSWPWMMAVLVRNEDEHTVCGGVLVEVCNDQSNLFSDIVLTSAHCVTYTDGVRTLTAKKEDVIVVGGIYDIEKKYEEEPGRAVMYVDAVDIYPTYTIDKMYFNDLAIITMNETLSVEDGFIPACLPFGSAFNKKRYYKKCYITGWGDVKENPEEAADKLREAKQYQASNDDCLALRRMVYSEDDAIELNEQTFCSLPNDGHSFGAEGDSGGPFICKKGAKVWRKSRWVLHGIISFGTLNSRNETIMTTSAWLRYPPFWTWIQEKILEKSGVCQDCGRAGRCRYI